MEAAVVGSGPNGLAAAVRLAQAGVKVRVHEAAATIGGGTRTSELTLPGFQHDVCSAVHPFAVLSPFFSSLPLADHGLEWIHAPIAVAHPLEDGTAAFVSRSLAETAAALGEDRDAYLRLIGPLVTCLPALANDVLAPFIRVPKHPLVLSRFGLNAALSAKLLVSRFSNPRTRALFAGFAAHSFMALDSSFTASFPLLFAACAHVGGWPFPRGGAQAIADALASLLVSLGGSVTTNSAVSSVRGLGDVVLCDVAPANLTRLLYFRPRYRNKLLTFRPGPGIFKIDYALSAPVPWRAPECRQAGTVHVGGSFDDVAASELAMARGSRAERPFVLVAQPSLFDSTRAPPGKHVLWAYCHVPNGSNVDMTAPIEAQIERFAPGFRDTILARSVMNSAAFERYNPNYIGGDISGGGVGPLAIFARPTLSLDPYATPVKGIYLCSASTPPGAGVHGMCGYHAAESALKRSFARG